MVCNLPQTPLVLNDSPSRITSRLKFIFYTWITQFRFPAKTLHIFLIAPNACPTVCVSHSFYLHLYFSLDCLHRAIERNVLTECSHPSFSQLTIKEHNAAVTYSHFNIIISSTLVYCMRSFRFRSSDWNFAKTPYVLHTPPTISSLMSPPQ